MADKLRFTNGTFYKRGNSWYVQATEHTTNGSKVHKRSIGKKTTNLNNDWVSRQKPINVLLNILGIDKNESIDTQLDIERYGYKVLKATSVSRGKDSQEDYERVLRKIIVPYFKRFKIEDIKSLDLLTFFNYVYEETSYHRAKRTKLILRLILTEFYDNEDVAGRNPFESRQVKRHYFPESYSETESYTIDEVNKMLSSATGWMKVYIEIGLKLGLRPGEIISLKWSDFDFDRECLMLKRNISRGVVKEYTAHMKQNKKNHFREIFLFPETVEILKSYYEFRPHDEWLFVSRYNTHYANASNILSHLKKFLKSINVRYKANYAMRRFNVSIQMQSEQIDVADIQETVGHVKGSYVTDKHYNKDILPDFHKQKKARERGEIFNRMRQIS